MPSVHPDFGREKLYEEIEGEPVSNVSKNIKYPTSGSAKICVSLDIPVAPIGCWAGLVIGRLKKLTPTNQPRDDLPVRSL
jgi:hypothetical protein